MSTSTLHDESDTATGGNRTGGHGVVRRISTETKQAYKTTEFWIYVVAAVGVLIAGQLVGSDNSAGDYFRADKAWLYVVLLTIGYQFSRGLAKSGSRDYYDDRRDS